MKITPGPLEHNDTRISNTSSTTRRTVALEFRSPLALSPRDSTPSRLQPAHAVTTLGRHVGLLAQGEPDVPRRDAGVQRLQRRPAEPAEDQVVRESRRAPAELVVDSAQEFTASHPCLWSISA